MAARGVKSLLDELAQSAPHLVIAAKVAEVGAQKHIPALAGNAPHQTIFEILWLHDRMEIST
jgi:hypothetical protein